MTTLEYQILLRRDTAATWTSENPVLGEGEIGYETDTGYIKIGDGTTAWTSLAYKGMYGPASATDNALARFDSTTGKILQNSSVTVDDNGSIDIPSGQSYKINNVALAASDVGAAASDHDHADVYEPADAAIQTHITAVTGNPHSVTYTEVGAAASDHDHDSDYISVVAAPTAGNLAALTEGGEIGDSGSAASDFAASDHNHDSDYISVVGAPTAGNFAALTEGGELSDSGHKDADYADAGHDHADVYEPADAAIQTHITAVTGNPHAVTRADVDAGIGGYDAIVYISGSDIIAEDAYGAEIESGTAGTDDTTVLQAAIDAGARVVLTGSFTLDTSLEVTETGIDVEIVGMNATLNADFGTKAAMIVLTLTGGTARVTGLRAVGANNQEAFVEVAGTPDHVWIGGNIVQNTGWHSVYVHASNVTVQGNVFDDIGKEGEGGVAVMVYTTDTDIENIHVLGNRCVGMRDDNCIYCSAAGPGYIQNAVVSGNICLDAYDGTGEGAGIKTTAYTRQTVVAGNRIADCHVGISAHGTQNTYADNLCTGCDYGIIVYGSDLGVLNNVFDKGSTVDASASDIRFIGNRFSADTAGMLLYVNGDNIRIQGNEFHPRAGSTSVWGIKLNEVSNIHIHGNRFWTSATTGVAAVRDDGTNPSSDISILDNIVEVLANNVSILDFRKAGLDSLVIRGNLIRADTEYSGSSIRVTGCSKLVCEGNIFENLPVPLTLADTPGNRVRSNDGHIEVGELRECISGILEILGDCRLILPCVQISGTSVLDYSRYSNAFAASASVATWHGWEPKAVYYNFNGTTLYLYKADDADFTFGDGSNDSAFSVFCALNMDDVTSRTVMAKWDATTDTQLREWRLYFDANGYPTFECYDESENAYIGRQDQTAFTTGAWKILAITYDGSGASSGIKIYIDGVQLDDANVQDGSYAAMEDTATQITIGSHEQADGNQGMFLDGKATWIGIAAKELSVDKVWSLTQRLKGVLGV